MSTLRNLSTFRIPSNYSSRGFRYPHLTRRTMAILAPTEPVSPTDRQANLEYIMPDSKINRRYMAGGREVSTGKYESKKVLIRDGRPELGTYTLETTGFQLIKHTSMVSPLFVPKKPH